jgi:hypothetical protein
MRRLSTGHSLLASNDSLSNNRGLDPTQLSLNQQNFVTLQNSLKQTDHLPYSLWPRRTSEIGHLNPISRTLSHTQRFSITPVTSADRTELDNSSLEPPSSAPGSTGKSGDKEVFKF